MIEIGRQARWARPWNKGRLVGQKPPLKLQEVWELRFCLKQANRFRDLALFNLAIDSKLRGCDLVKIRVADIVDGTELLHRAMALQKKTHKPVRFEITRPTREALELWINKAQLSATDYLFPSRGNHSRHITTRHYARIVKCWVAEIGLNPAAYGTHSLRRTKATQIYKQTKNLRAVQLLLGHTKLESTIRYLGVEVDDALEISEAIEV